MRTLALLPLLALPVLAENLQSASGTVFEDLNRNGVRDENEPGLPNVLVSNQREVVPTDADGSWTLPLRDETIFFVIKPSGWSTPHNDHRLPQFFYNHKPAGSPASKHPGVNPFGSYGGMKRLRHDFACSGMGGMPLDHHRTASSKRRRCVTTGNRERQRKV